MASSCLSAPGPASATKVVSAWGVSRTECISAFGFVPVRGAIRERVRPAGRQMMSHATPSPYPDAHQTREREPADYENLLGGLAQLIAGAAPSAVV